MIDEKDHYHLECPQCGMLWKEVKYPQDNPAEEVWHEQCPRCNTAGKVTHKR